MRIEGLYRTDRQEEVTPFDDHSSVRLGKELRAARVGVIEPELEILGAVDWQVMIVGDEAFEGQPEILRPARRSGGDGEAERDEPGSFHHRLPPCARPAMTLSTLCSTPALSE